MNGAALLLAAAIVGAIPGGRIPPGERATWYGARCPEGTTHYGRRDTCSPYRSKEDGGRGGELVYYAAVAGFRVYHDAPYRVVVRNKQNGRRVVVVVRDRCGACQDGRSLIDLSPAAFMALGLTLRRGIARVELLPYGAEEERRTER